MCHNPKQLPDLADRIQNILGDPAVVVLGETGGGAQKPAGGGHPRRG